MSHFWGWCIDNESWIVVGGERKDIERTKRHQSNSIESLH